MDSIIRGEKVMLSGKARAHTNIALIKYGEKPMKNTFYQ